MKLNLLYTFKDHHIYSTCVKIIGSISINEDE